MGAIEIRDTGLALKKLVVSEGNNEVITVFHTQCCVGRKGRGVCKAESSTSESTEEGVVRDLFSLTSFLLFIIIF